MHRSCQIAPPKEMAQVYTSNKNVGAPFSYTVMKQGMTKHYGHCQLDIKHGKSLEFLLIILLLVIPLISSTFKSHIRVFF